MKKVYQIIIIILIANIFISSLFLVIFMDYPDFFKDCQNIKSSAPLTPKGLRLTSNSTTKQNITITWYTENTASEPKVVYSENPTLLNNITITPSMQNVSGTYLYTAYLSNLESNHMYFYQASSDSSNVRETLNFTTTSERNTNVLKFLMFGDSRTQREERKKIAEKIVSCFDDIDFTIHTGDIVEDGRNQTQWNNYFDDVEILSKYIPGYYIEGNHEYTDGKMYENINLPSNGMNSYYYSFSLGPIKFIGLNTNRDEGIQTSWLESELNLAGQDNETFWKIAYMHEPIFNSMAGRSDRSDLIPTWCPLFEQHGVDLVFAGHNHYYERSYPMNNLKESDNDSLYEFNNPSNPMYFITGGAGAPLYTLEGSNPDYTAHYNSTYHFIVIEVQVDDVKEETTLTLETWAMPENAGEFGVFFLIDNITITKKGALLNIDNPRKNNLFGQNAPEFNVSFSNRNLDPTWYSINSTWYTIDGGLTNFTFENGVGTIDQLAWNKKPNGTVNTLFFANDTLGVIYSNEVTVQKDIIAPQISVNLPIMNQTFGEDAPIFNITIKDANLIAMWYSLDGGLTNITFTINGSISQIEWNKLPNGIVVITFYAKDSMGNVAYQERIVTKYISESNNDLILYDLDLIFIITITVITIIVLISIIIISWRKKLFQFLLRKEF